MTASLSIASPEFVISHIANAPRERVWRAFTDREEFMRWFGPQGFTMPTCTLDLQIGGACLYDVRSPEGLDFWGKWVYREIEAPEKLVYTMTFSDEEGGITRHPMNPTWPIEHLSTMTFVERNGTTEITLRSNPVNPTEEELDTYKAGLECMQQGWGGTFGRLDEYLAAN